MKSGLGSVEEGERAGGAASRPKVARVTAAPSLAQPTRLAAWHWLAGLLAIVFGLATVIEGGHTLFGGPAARAEAGQVVSFVLAFNFGAGFAYLLAGAAALTRRRWAAGLAVALAAATLAVFAAFGVQVLHGGAYERRTVIAMSVRSLFWVAQALVLWRRPARLDRAAR